MKDDARIDRWLNELRITLGHASMLSGRGRTAFDQDPALPLAFEALSNRVGDLAKRLAAADPERFSHPVWSQAARNRDFIVHRYELIDPDALWNTVTESFAEVSAELDRVRR